MFAMFITISEVDTEQVEHCRRRYVEGCVESYPKIPVELLG